MITIVAHMQCVPAREPEIMHAAQWFVAATQCEPGCVEFHLHRQLDDPTRFVWYENFADQAAVDTHVGSGHVRRWFELIVRLGARNTYALYSRLSAS